MLGASLIPKASDNVFSLSTFAQGEKEMTITSLKCVTLGIIALILPASSQLAPSMQQLLSAQKALQESSVASPDVFSNTSQHLGSIDEETYRLGTGDKLSIKVIEDPSINFLLEINSNGDLFIPEFGPIDLEYVSLLEGKEKIASFLNARMRSTKTIYVSLHATKQANIIISGPNTPVTSFALPGSARLVDALNKTFPNAFSAHAFNYRAVTIVGKHGTNAYDLLPFIYGADIRSNPYLFPGDRIILTPSYEHVWLHGAITLFDNNGRIPLKPGETIAELLSFTHLDPNADTSTITIQRGKLDADRPMRTLSMQEARGIALQDNDVVSIALQPNRPQIRIVTVQGEVLRPGLYPIENNRTTLDAILAQAGGTKADACLQRIAVIRKKKQQDLESIIRSPANQALESISSAPPLALTARPEISTSFSELLKTRDYLVISPMSTNAPIILTEGDMVVVPKKEGLIHIHGHVKNPGAYSLKENASQRVYIKRAGGLSKKADRNNIYVVRQYGDAMHILEAPTIVDGDIILVPMGQENKQLTRIILPVFSTAATMINVFLAVLALAN